MTDISSSTATVPGAPGPTRPPRRILRCSYCKSEDVVRDAWACWSVENQEWELGEVFDHSFCTACESECAIEESTP